MLCVCGCVSACVCVSARTRTNHWAEESNCLQSTVCVHTVDMQEGGWKWWPGFLSRCRLEMREILHTAHTYSTLILQECGHPKRAPVCVSEWKPAPPKKQKKNKQTINIHLASKTHKMSHKKRPLITAEPVFFFLRASERQQSVIRRSRTTWAAATTLTDGRSNSKLWAAVTVTEGHMSRISSWFLKLFIQNKQQQKTQQPSFRSYFFSSLLPLKFFVCTPPLLYIFLFLLCYFLMASFSFYHAALMKKIWAELPDMTLIFQHETWMSVLI